MGLFLSYPPEDVKGFIAHRANDFKCAGLWKVYGDEEKARSLGAREIHLCAQVRAKGFYESLGYAAYGETVYDESVPHTMMQKRL